MSRISDKSAFEAFARMEEKISVNEKQIQAHIEIDEEFSGDALSREFKRLESGASADTADLQLLELKQKMGLVGAGAPPTGRQLGAGATAAEEAEAVIETHEEKTGP